jgi:hypothetical protein
MNKKEYVDGLRRRNGTCGCAALTGLFELETQTATLGSLCETGKAQQRELPTTENVHEYQAESQEMRKSAGDFDIELNRLAEVGAVRLMLHSRKTKFPIGYLQYAKGLELAQQKRLISIHCGRCEQQIGITY